MINFRNLAGAALLGVASLTIAIAPANAAACRGPNGRFVKCGAPAAKSVAAKPRAMAKSTASTPVRTAVLKHRAAVATPAKAATKPAAHAAPKKG